MMRPELIGDRGGRRRLRALRLVTQELVRRRADDGPRRWGPDDVRLGDVDAEHLGRDLDDAARGGREGRIRRRQGRGVARLAERVFDLEALQMIGDLRARRHREATLRNARIIVFIVLSFVLTWPR